MKEQSNDFMVDIVNSDAAMTTPELLISVAGVVLVVAVIAWWIIRK